MKSQKTLLEILTKKVSEIQEIQATINDNYLESKSQLINASNIINKTNKLLDDKIRRLESSTLTIDTKKLEGELKAIENFLLAYKPKYSRVPIWAYISTIVIILFLAGFAYFNANQNQKLKSQIQYYEADLVEAQSLINSLDRKSKIDIKEEYPRLNKYIQPKAEK